MSSDWERIASSRPVNRQASLSSSRGVEDPRPELADCPDLMSPEEIETKVRHGNFVDLTGLRVGRLEVLGLKKKGPGEKTTRGAWVCLCHCGRYLTVKASHLKKGKLDRCKSCQLNHLGRHESYPSHVVVDVTPPLAANKVINRHILSGNFVDLSGLRIGNFSVLGLSGLDGRGIRPKWVCRCDCGRHELCNARTLKAGRIDRCESCRLTYYETHGFQPEKVRVDVPDVTDRADLRSVETFGPEVVRPQQVPGWIPNKDKEDLNGGVIKEDYLAGSRIVAIEILGGLESNSAKDKRLALKCECNDTFSMLRSKVLSGEASACKKCIRSRPNFTVERWKTELVSSLRLLRSAAELDQSAISIHDYSLLNKAIAKLQGSRSRSNPDDQVSQNGMTDALGQWFSPSENGAD